MNQDQITANGLAYSEDLYQAWLKDPSKVDPSWRSFFRGFHTGFEQSGPSSRAGFERELKASHILQFYRDHGRRIAKLNPLEGRLPERGETNSHQVPDLRVQGRLGGRLPERGETDSRQVPDLRVQGRLEGRLPERGETDSRQVPDLRVQGRLEGRLPERGETDSRQVPDLRVQGRLEGRLPKRGETDSHSRFLPKELDLSQEDESAPCSFSESLLGKGKSLKDLISFLEEKYCGAIALNAGACPPEVRRWFFNEFEKASFALSKEQKTKAFGELARASRMEKFLHFRFLGKKRFSLEGMEALIPMLDYLISKGSRFGVKDMITGMPHRGRISVLLNIMRQDPQVLLSQFEDHQVFEGEGFAQDVKYHLGFASLRETAHGPCRLYLAYNPSHLEAIGSVVCGMSRAAQRRNRDTQERQSVLPVIIHGDAAFCGQGCVSETLQLSRLKGYTVGGALHIILNNQIGFTTLPEEGRSSPFASDLAGAIQAPVLLVNADNVELCLKAVDMAFRFRHKFKQDVFIELTGYRKHGHNEGDEPSFTQPALYKKIKAQPCVVDIYKSQLISEGLFDQEKAEGIIRSQDQFWESQLQELRKSPKTFSLEDYRGDDKGAVPAAPLKPSGPGLKILNSALKAVSEEPKGIHLHPKIKKILEKRRQAVAENRLDWTLCELSAYGSLLQEGFSVRLTGQDSKRGTFSHRHAAYYDYEDNRAFVPLKHIAEKFGREFCLYNSPLSEMAVLGFEYGNSCLAPDFLTLWEAQFGDFANGAQIIIDQFISAGERKWLQATDIVLLLPHGYEGQGPEHSSAYLERFLQLSAQDNIRVCNFTCPANFFHALRRQKILLKERKPLIVMSPKSLLRHPGMTARIENLAQGNFQEILWDKDIEDLKKVENVVLLSGKIYYDLKAKLDLKENTMKKNRTAVFRLEQMYPFPEQALNPALNGFPRLSQIIWLQEEPKNRGAWLFVKERLESLLKNLGQSSSLHYEGRPARSASAEGSEPAHKKEQNRMIQSCLSRL